MTLVNTSMDYEAEDGPFFYLCGPMTKMPDHNFHEFRRVAAKLREAHMRIVMPYDLADQPAPSEGGNPPESYTKQGLDLLRRAVNIVMDPNCVGLIALPGWEDSFGTLIETYIGEAWGRDLYAYKETTTGNPMLVYMQRADVLGPRN